MGPRAAAAGVAQQASAHPREWRRAHSDQRARRAPDAGADLRALGLVRRRVEGWLAMRTWRVVFAAAAVWASAIVVRPDLTAQGGPLGAAHKGVEFATSDNCLA